MAGPALGDDELQGRLGVFAVAQIVTSLGCGFRETQNLDLGIDAQIEFRGQDRTCNGHVIAAQIKSGASYVERGTETAIAYYPEAKHREYWANFPLPVILMVHDPATGRIHWLDARRWLRAPETGGERVILIPRSQTLDARHLPELEATCGSFGERPIEIRDLPLEMVRQSSRDIGFDLCFLDIFTFGLTNLCRHVFFSMDVCMNIAEHRAERHGVGVGMGGPEYDFVGRYIRFLIAQNLIYCDFSDLAIDWEIRERVPTFLAQLSPRGRALAEHLHRQYDPALYHERFIGLKMIPTDYADLPRLDAVRTMIQTRLTKK